MKLKQRIVLGALAALPFAAGALQAVPGTAQQADPLDASATVPASAYVSAFRQYRPVADDPKSPDQVWRAANDEVGRLGGHAGHIAGKGNAGSAPVVSDSSPAPARMAPMHQGKHHH